MDVNKYFTVENLLKVLLAVAIGFMLYKLFFAKESFYTCKNDASGHAYPMSYEHDTDHEVENFDDFESYENELQGVDGEGNLYKNAKNGTPVYDDKADHEMIDDEDDDDDDYEENDDDDDDDDGDNDDGDDEEEDDEEDDEKDYEYLYASDHENDNFKENYWNLTNDVGIDKAYR